MSRAKIAAYFHYQPTFYHLHVHFVHVNRTLRDTRENVSLDSVIANIEMVSDFYQRTTLTYKIGTQTPLFEVLVHNKVLQPEPEVLETETEAEEQLPAAATTDKTTTEAVKAAPEDDGKK